MSLSREAVEMSLDALNRRVREAIQARTEFLDMVMTFLPPLKPGDEIYNLTTGDRLGTVVGAMRWHSGELSDDSLNFYYTFRPPGQDWIDNTSRMSLPASFCGTKDQARARLQERIDYL